MCRGGVLVRLPGGHAVPTQSKWMPCHTDGYFIYGRARCYSDTRRQLMTDPSAGSTGIPIGKPYSSDQPPPAPAGPSPTEAVPISEGGEPAPVTDFEQPPAQSYEPSAAYSTGPAPSYSTAQPAAQPWPGGPTQSLQADSGAPGSSQYAYNEPAPAYASSTYAPVAQVGQRRAKAPGLTVVAVLVSLVGAWGGLVPFIGPTFGLDADGTHAWKWSLAHAVLWVSPGATALLVGLIIIKQSRAVGRAGPLITGLVVAICGAWFVVGPLVWPTFEHGHVIFLLQSPTRVLVREVGWSLAPGAALLLLGGCAIGLALRPKDRDTTL